MNSSELSFTYLLQETQKFPKSEREQLFLKTFPDTPFRYEQILSVISINEDHNVNPISFAQGCVSSAVEVADASSYVGKTFDNWVTTEVIATTGKSVILKAIPADNSYLQEVAIKIATPIFGQVTQNSHLKKQAHLMEVLKHKNLTELKGAGTACGVDYLAMEYLTGQDIVEHCRANSLPLLERLKLFKQVCECIGNMHNYEVIHSDIKPANILMNGSTAKVLDFDLSNVLDEQVHSGFDYANIDGQTKEYASPEQLVSGTATKKSDIFSLGKVLFEMLTGNKLLNSQHNESYNAIYALFGKKRYVKEVCSIIDKASQIIPQHRYDTIDSLIDDVNRVFSSKVVKAYNGNFLLPYRAYKKICYNAGISLAAAVIVPALFFTTLNAYQENNTSDYNISAIASIVDPRTSNGRSAFDILATNVYNKSWILSSKRFSQLQEFGDAYYGMGDFEKAVKFFSKAQSIYTDKYCLEYITVTSKLALAKYTLGDIDEALAELQDYRGLIFSGEVLSEPAHVSMLFAMIEINSQVKYLDWLGEAYDVRGVFGKIDVSGLGTDQEKLINQANMLFFEGIEIYYDLPHGDIASSSVLHSESEYQTVTIPALLIAKEKLERALSLLTTNGIKTHRIPLIYLWLGRLHSELRNPDTAIELSQKGVHLTKTVFGLKHPRVVDALLKQYATLRFIAPKQSYNVIKNAVSISNSFKKNRYTLYVYPILFEASLALGDLNFAREAFKEAIRVAKSQEVPLSEIDLRAITSMSETYIDFLFKHSFDEDIIPLLDSKYALGGDTDSLLPLHEEMSNFVRAKQNENHGDISRKIHQDFEEELASYREGEQYIDFRFVGIRYADLCASVPDCDPVSILDKTAEFEQWTKSEELSSFDKLIYQLRKANDYIAVKRYAEANLAIEDVRLILEFVTVANKNNVYIAIFNEIKIKYLIHTKEYAEAKLLIDSSILIASLHFHPSTRIYRSLQSLKAEIEQMSI